MLIFGRRIWWRTNSLGKFHFCQWRFAVQLSSFLIDFILFFHFRISVTFVDKDGEEKHIKVPIGMSMLEAAHENDIELEGKNFLRPLKSSIVHFWYFFFIVFVNLLKPYHLLKNIVDWASTIMSMTSLFPIFLVAKFNTLLQM